MSTTSLFARLLSMYSCSTELIPSMIHDGIKFCRATQEGHLRPPCCESTHPCQMRGDTPAATITRSKLSGSRAAPYLTTFGSCITSAVPVTYTGTQGAHDFKLQRVLVLGQDSFSPDSLALTAARYWLRKCASRRRSRPSISPTEFLSGSWARNVTRLA